MRIIINPKYNSIKSAIEAIHTTFGGEDNIVYQARNTLKSINIAGVNYIVKCYATPILINRFAYTFLRPTKAKRAYENAMMLTNEGIGTPTPVAYIEIKRCGLFKHSYFISEEATGGTLMRRYTGYIDPRFGANVLIQLARFTKRMHDKGFLHLDYSTGNILFWIGEGDDVKFALIDLNRMKFGREFSRKELIYSFRRLTRSDEVLSILVSEYAHLSGWSVEDTVAEAKLYKDRFWAKTDRKIALKRKIRGEKDD